MTIVYHPNRRIIITLTLVLLAVACERQDPAPKAELPNKTSQAPLPAPSENGRTTPQVSYAEVVDRVGPGVVTIRSERRVRAPRQHPFFNDPFFGELFGGPFGGTAPGVP